MISQEPQDRFQPNLTYLFSTPLKRTLLILGSVGQRSRSFQLICILSKKFCFRMISQEPKDRFQPNLTYLFSTPHKRTLSILGSVSQRSRSFQLICILTKKFCFRMISQEPNDQFQPNLVCLFGTHHKGTLLIFGSVGQRSRSFSAHLHIIIKILFLDDKSRTKGSISTKLDILIQ